MSSFGIFGGLYPVASHPAPMVSKGNSVQESAVFVYLYKRIEENIFLRPRVQKFYTVNPVQCLLIPQAIPFISEGQLKVSIISSCDPCFQNLPLILDDFPLLKLYS